MLYVPCGIAEICFVYNQTSFSTLVYLFTTQAFDASISIIVSVLNTTSQYHSLLSVSLVYYKSCIMLLHANVFTL
jgi:hypothetical protein